MLNKNAESAPAKHGGRTPVSGAGRGGKRRGRRRDTIFLGVAVLVVFALLVLSLFVGVYDIAEGERGEEMFFITRLPRTLALMLAGAAMSVAGLVMQMVTQNRFVDATTSGTTEWAGLGILLVAIFKPDLGLINTMLVATFFAFVGAMTFMLILRRIAIRSMLVVPLIGIMLGAVVSAVTTYLAMSENLLQMLGTWFMGSFATVVRGRYEVLWIVAAVTVAVFLLADRITVAGLGKDIAKSVGLHYEGVIIKATALVAIAAGVTTVVVGFLPFLGLVVPNIVSWLRGDNVRSNLLWVCLGGVGLVAVCDIIGRIVRMPYEVPVSMVLGLVGASVFITLLLRRRDV